MPFAKRWARGTPGGKVKRYRKLPNKVKKKESPLLALLKANYGAKRGQVIQGRLIRGEGGQFASSGGGKPAAASGTPAKRRRAPPKTDEQRAADRASAREQRTQERAATQEQNIAKTFSAIGMDEDAADSLRRLANGEAVGDDGGLVKMGLAEQAQDGSYRLTAAGRSVMNAAERGDLGAARDAKSRAQDKATAAAEQAAAESAELLKPAGGGGGKKKEPVKLPPRQTSQLAKPVLGGGGGGGKKKEPPKAQPQIDPALTALARRLSAGEALDETEGQTLVRNGLARIVKGTLILTQSGMRSIRGKAANPLAWLRRKATTVPTRTLNAGHTGVMVALHPDDEAVKSIVALPGVTEPADQIHLTLAYLGDSTEQPLATNKARLIETIRQWAGAHGRPLKGTINGAGRFFHAEGDGTNAVWVAPDVAGLPESRQSLVAAIEAGGFDYSQDHGFTPHITVAYVPKDEATPPIRIDQPVTFDRATLAWGDEQYDFPLGRTTAKASNPGDYLVVEDRTKPSTWHLPVKKNGTPNHRLMGAAWAALHGGYRGNKYEGPQKSTALAKLKRLYASEGMDVPTEKAWASFTLPVHGGMALVADGPGSELISFPVPSFTVYKDASGTHRWIARSTTAYRDRDKEILPIAVLDLDSQRMTATKQYGPLRWWHVGRPDALNPAAPWGAGLDIGTCDFSMQIGRTRVESGTFKDAEIARRIAATAYSYELSPGFFHAADQPDASGIFHSIHTFERSLVPIAYGRASNLFTGLTVKEHTTMDAAEQERRFKAAIEQLQLTPEQAATFAAGLVATDKAASTTPDPATGQPGVAYKSDQSPTGFMDVLRRWVGAGDDPPLTTTKTEEPLPVASPPDPLLHAIAAQTAQIADLTSTLKAAMEAPIEEEVAEEEIVTEEEETPTEDAGGATIGDMTAQQFSELLGAVLAQALAGAMGGISDKVAQLDNEMKGMGYTRVKEEQEKADKIAALKAQIDQQQSQLADLLGDQPAISPVRPSQDPNNILQGLKDADPAQPEFAFADISAHLFGQQPVAH